MGEALCGRVQALHVIHACLSSGKFTVYRHRDLLCVILRFTMHKARYYIAGCDSGRIGGRMCVEKCLNPARGAKDVPCNKQPESIWHSKDQKLRLSHREPEDLHPNCLYPLYMWCFALTPRPTIVRIEKMIPDLDFRCVFDCQRPSVRLS